MRGGRNWVTLLLCGALLLSVPATAPADPGSPDLDSAAAAVYPRVGGEDQVSPDETGNTQEPSNTGDVAGIATETGDSDGGLPFTGLSAVLVLGAAVVLLGGGALMRLGSRRPDSGSGS
jgi:hypothetical protein